MIIETLTIGAYENNCYIVRKDQEQKDCVIIDTGLDEDRLIEFLKENDYNPKAVLLTHGHADHIYAVPCIRDNFSEVKVYVHKEDAKALMEPHHNLSMMGGIELKTSPADVQLSDGDVINESGIELRVLHTPGHSPGGICFYNEKEKILFSGDTLFCDSVGRTDLRGGNMQQLLDSIQEKLVSLPDEVKVLPGHGPETTMGNEKRYNQYLQF